MADERKQRKCKACGVKVLAIRPGTNHLLHFFLTLFTGVWIFGWIWASLKFGGWKCPTCGSKC